MSIYLSKNSLVPFTFCELACHYFENFHTSCLVENSTARFGNWNSTPKSYVGDNAITLQLKLNSQLLHNATSTAVLRNSITATHLYRVGVCVVVNAVRATGFICRKFCQWKAIPQATITECCCCVLENKFGTSINWLMKLLLCVCKGFACVWQGVWQRVHWFSINGKRIT